MFLSKKIVLILVSFSDKTVIFSLKDLKSLEIIDESDDYSLLVEKYKGKDVIIVIEPKDIPNIGLENC